MEVRGMNRIYSFSEWCHTGLHLCLPQLKPSWTFPLFLPILVFSCWVTNYHNLSNAKQYSLTISKLLWVGSPCVFCSRSQISALKVSAGLHSHPDTELVKNPLLDSFRLLAGFISLLLEDWGPQCLAGSWQEAALHSWKQLHNSQPHGPLHGQFTTGPFASSKLAGECLTQVN